MSGSGAPSRPGFPRPTTDERELLLGFLGYLRNAVVAKAAVADEDARWRPDGRLVPLVGLVNHLRRVEWRWISGGFEGAVVERSEEEFFPGEELGIEAAIASYRARAEATDAFVRAAASLELESASEPGASLRFVLVHLINETARHAGHADAVRELLDGTTGE